MCENWKTFKETKRIKYEISNLGRIKKNNKLFEPKINKTNNYYMFGGYYLHRIVAELFVENPLNKKCVDHIDTNRHNNRADNLRWVSYKENSNNELTRSHISKSLKSLTYNRKGNNNGMYGKHHSEESKQKQSIKRKNYWNNISLEDMKHRSMILSEHAKGRIWINNGKENKFILVKDFINYSGFTRGKISKAHN